MIFSVLNSEAVSTSGTSLVGTVKTTYGELVEKFDEPTYTSVSYTHLALPTKRIV